MGWQCLVRWCGTDSRISLGNHNHMQAITAKKNKTSVFISHNLNGCLLQVNSRCCKGIICPVLNASIMWDPDQKDLTLESELCPRESSKTSSSSRTSHLVLKTASSVQNSNSNPCSVAAGQKDWCQAHLMNLYKQCNEYSLPVHLRYPWLTP